MYKIYKEEIIKVDKIIEMKYCKYYLDLTFNKKLICIGTYDYKDEY
jgi:hypothetical protein